MINIECFGSSSAGNCYRIKSSVNGDELLLDVGLPFKTIQRACRYNFLHLLGAVVTHQHGDHSRAVADMLKLGHKIYMLRETADALHVVDEHSWVEISNEVYLQYCLLSYNMMCLMLAILFQMAKKNCYISQILTTANTLLKVYTTYWLSAITLTNY